MIFSFYLFISCHNSKYQHRKIYIKRPTSGSHPKLEFKFKTDPMQSNKRRMRFTSCYRLPTSLLLALCLVATVSAAISGSIKTTPGARTINRRSNIEFALGVYGSPGPLQRGDAVHLEFSEDYAMYFAQAEFAGAASTQLSSTQCLTAFDFGLGEQDGSQLDCQVVPAEKTIIIKLRKDATLRPMGINITDMIMPDKVKTAVVYVELRSSSGETYDRSARFGPGALSITPTAADLRSASLSNSDGTVGGRGELTVTIETANKVAGGANIRMQFPKWAGGLSYVEAEGTVCSLARGGASNIASDATCTLDTRGSSFDEVLIRQAFTRDVEAGRSITFIVEGVRNYPSMRGVSGIEIQTQTLAGYAVDERLNNGFAPTAAAEAPATNYQLSMDATVSERVSVTLALLVLNPCSADTEITIVFPPEIDASQLSSVTPIGSSGGGPPEMRMATSPGGSRADTVIIKKAFNGDQRAGQLTLLSLDSVVAPPSDAETSPFKFELAEVDGSDRYAIEGNSEGVTVRAKEAEFSSYELTTSTNAVFAAFDADLRVSFDGIIQRSNILNVVYPPAFKLNPERSRDECSVSLGGSDNAGRCTVTEADRTIVIREFATRDYDRSTSTGGRTIRIRLTNMLVNPPSEKPVDSGFSIHLRDGHGHNVAKYDASKFISDNEYKAHEINIRQFTIRTMNGEAGVASKALVNMQILEGQTFTGLQMKIKLPTEVDYADQAKVVCRKAEVLDRDPECSVVTENGSKLLKVVFKGIGQSTALTGATAISFSIDSLRNPYSTAPSSSFHVQLLDSQGHKIAVQNTGIFVQVSEGSKLQEVVITPASKVNGAETTYRFQVTLRNPLPSGSVLTITAPPEVIFAPSVGSRVRCVGEAELADRISCIWQQKQVFVTLDSEEEMKSGQVLDFSLPLVKNPPSMKRSSSFALKAEYGSGTISVDNCCHTVQNTEAATIASAGVAVASSGAATSYNISFTAANPLPDTGFIRVTFPSEVQRVDDQALACTAITDMAAEASGRLDCEFNTDSNELTISLNASQPKELAFAVEGFKSPDTFTLTESFQIRTFTADWDRIDQVTSGVGTTSRCQKPCKSCLLNETTCTECYADSQLKYLQNNDCYRDCGAGTYGGPAKDGKVRGYVCLQCASDCETCNGTASKCTRCADPEKLLMPDGSCRGKCRDGQYADQSLSAGNDQQSIGTTTCVDCPAKCTKCSSPTECEECAAGYLYHNKTCVKTCPSDMIANPDQTTCVPCKKPCLSCAGTADKCTKCDLSAGSKAPFLYGSQCLAKCPDRYFGELPNSSTCELVQEDVIPFTFFVAAFLVAMAVGVLKLYSIKVWTKKMHYKNTIIALISVVCQGNWIYVLYLAIVGKYWQSSVILLFGIGCSYVLNLVFFFLYLKVMRHDEYYDRWRQGRKLGEGVLVAMALLTSFQLYRLVFQQLAQSIKLKKEEDLKKQEQEAQNEGGQPVEDNAASGAESRASASGPPVANPAREEPRPVLKRYKTQDENTVKSIFNTLSIVMISCVLLPVLVQNIYSLTITHPGQRIFWEDIESLALTFCLLCMMLYDSYKKTKKVEGSKLKQPTPSAESGRLWAGIPAGLTNKQEEARRVEDMFKSPGDIKRFRDVLTLMLRNQVQAGGGDLDHEDSVDADQVDSNTSIGKLRQHFKAGRLRNLDHTGAPRPERHRQLEMTGMSHRQDQTDVSLVTEENLLGTSDRLLLKKQMEGEDLFGASGSAIFRQNQRAHGKAFQSGAAEDEDDANIEGTVESPNLLRRTARPQADADDAELDENIDSDGKNDEEWSDQNRQNIHGATDSVIYRNLGLQQEDLQDSSVQRPAEFAPPPKKSLIHRRLRGEDFAGRGPSNVDASNTDISALNDISVFKQEEQSEDKLSAFKSVPNHFSLVSGNQDASQNVTDDADQNPFAGKRPLNAQIRHVEGEVGHDQSIEQPEGGALTAGILTTTNRLSTHEAMAVNDSSLSVATSNNLTLPKVHPESAIGGSKVVEEQDKQGKEEMKNTRPEEDGQRDLQARDTAHLDQEAASNPVAGRESAPLQQHGDLSAPKALMKNTKKKRVHTTIIEEEEQDTEFDRRQSQLVSADADGVNISSALDQSVNQKPEEGAPSVAAESDQQKSTNAQADVAEASGGPSAPQLPQDTQQQDAKHAAVAAESGEQEIANADSSRAPTENRPSIPKSMQSVPIKESSKMSAEDAGGQGDDEEQLKQSAGNMNFMSGDVMLSANTSQLTVDEKNHPVEKIDEMQFKINIVDVEADAKGKVNKKENCTDCFQSRSMLSQRGRGGRPADKATSEHQQKAQLRTTQTTEDNFKNIEMLDNDLKMFKKVPENAQMPDSKRQAEIQNIKTAAQHRQIPMYSNSSMAKTKNEIGSELVKKSQSSQHSRDRDRPKTAELDAGDEAKKEDLTRISTTNAVKNAKWISIYDHSNVEGSKHDQSLHPLARDSSAQKSAAAEADDKHDEARSPEKPKRAQEESSYKRNLLYRGSQEGDIDSNTRKLLSKQQSQSIESKPEFSEHRDWFNKIKQEGEDQKQRPLRYVQSKTQHLPASSTSSPGRSGSPTKRLMYLNQLQHANINQGAGQAQSTTLRPMDIADPYNPKLVQRLGLKGTQPKSQAQSRSSQKDKAAGLIRDVGPRASVSQTAHKVQSAFSSRQRERQPYQGSRQESEEKPDAKQGQGELRSGQDQYDSTQIRVMVPKMEGGRNEMPFLNVKGKNTQAVQHYEKIMNRDLASASRQRSQDAEDSKAGKGGSSRTKKAHRSRQNRNQDRELERGRSQEQVAHTEEGLKQEKARRQKTSHSGRIAATGASLPAGNEPAEDGSRDDFLDKQISLMQNPSGAKHHDAPQAENVSNSNKQGKLNAQRSLRVSDNLSRPQSSNSKAPGASASSVAKHVAITHQSGKAEGACVLKSSANQIIQGTAVKSLEARDPAGAALSSQEPRQGSEERTDPPH